MNQKEELIKKIKEGDLDGLNRILKSVNFNIHEVMIEGTCTPLHVAVNTHKKDVIKTLLAHGANPEIKDDKNAKPFEYVALSSDTTKLYYDYLAENLSEIEQKRLNLLWAVAFKKVAEIRTLLTSEIDINTPIKTPDNIERLIFKAVVIGSPKTLYQETIKILIDHGANINCLNEFGTPALFFITRMLFSDEELDNTLLFLDYLIKKGADINILNENEENIFWNLYAQVETYHKNQFLIAQFLIENGLNINQKNKEGHSLYHVSIKSGNTQITKLLLNKGLHINNPEQLLSLALYSGMDTIKLITEMGVAINSKAIEGNTILYEAVRAGEEKTVAFLISLNADPNIHSGEAPLLRALEIGREDIALTLLKNKADPNIYNSYGEDAFTLAEEYNLEKVMRYLQENKNID